MPCTQRIEFAHGERRISKPAMGRRPGCCNMCIDQLRWIDGRCVFFWKRAR